ncbi:GNAT family protein [uncultured Sulfitobacter sp.]|uniref:GNAT family N-acetyltransferase n=1 Tax=uncultured Sulfitobacter sp. TaxID=191468 RepID=UPI00262401A1|nr:GNAT family protein [uncultured Sulfitobacter sp.]
MGGTRIEQSHWAFPKQHLIQGRSVTLEPLTQVHFDELWNATHAAPDSFDYLRYGPFEVRQSLKKLITDLSTRKDQPFWAVRTSRGAAQGWLSICDVSQADGAFEIGSIWFSPALQGTRAAREAIFLLMCEGMDTHRYERLVWRCQAQNEKSFKAALNLGFTHEGTWRNAAVVKGWQRDVAWFSVLKSEWPLCRAAFTAWLSDDNFDGDSIQRRRLQDIRAELAKHSS